MCLRRLLPCRSALRSGTNSNWRSPGTQRSANVRAMGIPSADPVARGAGLAPLEASAGGERLVAERGFTLVEPSRRRRQVLLAAVGVERLSSHCCRVPGLATGPYDRQVVLRN